MPFAIVATSSGRAALINAANTGTLPVVITQVGVSAAVIVPTEDDTALPGEIKRLSGASGLAVADDTIHVSALDDSADAYVARSVALYLADGTLFAVGGGPDPLFDKAAASLAALSLDVVFADINAAEISFGDAGFMNPPASETVQGVVELATPVEAQAGIDALRALTPATARAAVLGWLLVQDGAGSGLDADLLDGQHGAWYADIAARLGFTPVNRAGDALAGFLSLHAAPSLAAHAARKDYVDGLVTAAALLAKLLSVDGAGSGLDADLLDGQHGAWYTDIAARLGFTPVNRAGDALTGFLTLHAAPSADMHAATRKFVIDAVAAGALGYTPVNRAGDTMTGALGLPGAPTIAGHATRKDYVDALVTAAAIFAKILTLDGSGSGLDADLLDGKHASAFQLAAAFASGSNANGRWYSQPDGNGGTWLEQWGSRAATIEAVYPITFPQPYSAPPLAGDIQLTPILTSATIYKDNMTQILANTITETGFSVQVQWQGEGAQNRLDGISWSVKAPA